MEFIREFPLIPFRKINDLPVNPVSVAICLSGMLALEYRRGKRQAKFEAKIRELTEAIRELKDEIRELREEIRELKQEIRELKKEIRELKKEIRELKEGMKGSDRKTGGGTLSSLARDPLLITLNSYVQKYRFGDHIWGRFHSLQ
jgi:septal ring factor EnvC (AmiA/AmiB activator)